MQSLDFRHPEEEKDTQDTLPIFKEELNPGTYMLARRMSWKLREGQDDEGKKAPAASTPWSRKPTPPHLGRGWPFLRSPVQLKHETVSWHSPRKAVRCEAGLVIPFKEPGQPVLALVRIKWIGACLLRSKVSGFRF